MSPVRSLVWPSHRPIGRVWLSSVGIEQRQNRPGSKRLLRFSDRLKRRRSSPLRFPFPRSLPSFRATWRLERFPPSFQLLPSRPLMNSVQTLTEICATARAPPRAPSSVAESLESSRAIAFAYRTFDGSNERVTQ